MVGTIHCADLATILQGALTGLLTSVSLSLCFRWPGSTHVSASVCQVVKLQDSHNWEPWVKTLGWGSDVVGKMPLHCFQCFIGGSDLHNSLVHKNTLCFLDNTGFMNTPQCYVIHALPVLFNSNVQYVLYHNITAAIRMPLNTIRNSGDWFAQ